MASDVRSKIKTLEAIGQAVAKLKKQGKKVVQCHGVFDLVHPGHIRHLNSAKKLGDVLVVTTTADRYVNRGPGRPVFNQELRAETLANLEVTDYVGVINAPTAIEAIKTIRPDFYVKGPDYKDKDKDLTAKIYDEEDAVRSIGGEIVFTDDITFSSSQLINLHIDTYPEDVIKYLRKLGSNFSVDDITNWLKEIEKLKILVIGDAIIDQYHYCTALGKSSKESIVAQKYLSEEDFAGGALATANHVAQLCPNTELVTVLGANDSFEKFIKSKLNPGIKAKFFTRRDCVTTVKRRYIVQESNRKQFEVCYIDDAPLGNNEETKVINYLKKQIKKYDLVVVNDFGHGLLTRRIIDFLCQHARKLAINVQTNSANVGFNIVTKYNRADLVCIDEYELRLATREKTADVVSLIKEIQSKLRCKEIIATRGYKGSLSYSKKDGLKHTPAFSFKKVDAVGAGDAFFSYIAPCHAVGMPHEVSSFVGNAVGSIKIQIQGNREPVKKIDVLKFISRLMKV